MKARIVLAGVVLTASSLRAEQQKNPVDDAKVDAAIKRGVQYLRAKNSKKNQFQEKTRELVLLTLVHSGIRKGDPLLDELVKAVLDEDLTTTYRTALQAMALEELDRVAHQKRIFQCAQFLVDNQCLNGQWDYGQPTTYPEPEPEIVSGKQMFRVRKQSEGPDHGDHSNSQYAALGLRACHDSGIILPQEVVEKAARAWRESVTAKGGWSYGPKGNSPYGSMTAGGVAALTIFDHLLGLDRKKDECIAAGLNWLRDNFSVTDNPRRPGPHHYYYLYALARAGLLTETAKFGKFDWYLEGARYLLDHQVDDGSWNKKPVDTCFAILFLRRAARPLVASVDKK